MELRSQYFINIIIFAKASLVHWDSCTPRGLGWWSGCRIILAWILVQLIFASAALESNAELPSPSHTTLAASFSYLFTPAPSSWTWSYNYCYQAAGLSQEVHSAFVKTSFFSALHKIYPLPLLKFLYFFVEYDLGLLINFIPHLLLQILLLFDTLLLCLDVHFELLIVPISSLNKTVTLSFC